jgi:hypothetical protein
MFEFSILKVSFLDLVSGIDGVLLKEQTRPFFIKYFGCSLWIPFTNMDLLVWLIYFGKSASKFIVLIILSIVIYLSRLLFDDIA